jgi:thiol-disulfide isomerase/thioredoxin
MVLELFSNEEANAVLNNDNNVIIYFMLNTCKYCNIVYPYYLELEEKYKNQILFLKVNCSNDLDIIDKYDITKLPVFIGLKTPDTDPVYQFRFDTTNIEEFDNLINKLI